MEHSLRPGYAMRDDTPNECVSMTVKTVSMADGGNNPVPTVPSELAEHSTTVEDSLQPLQLETSEHLTDIRVVGDSDNQPVSEPTEQLRSGDNLSVHAEPLILKPAPAETMEQQSLKERSLPEVASELRQSEGPARIEPSGVRGSYCSGCDWVSGALVPHRMGPKC